MPNSKMKYDKEVSSCGLDIGSSAVKLVKVKLGQDGCELIAFDIQAIEQNLPEVLKRIKQDYSPENIAISVGGPSAVARYANFPRMSQDELRQALKFEAAKHIPFSIDEANLDGYILKEDASDNKMLVLLAAAKKELVAQRLKLVIEAGLDAGIVNMDHVSLANAFNFNYYPDDFLKNKAVALLNVGAALSSLDIIEDGIPRLSRDIHFGGNNLTQKISEIFGIDVRSAEALKASPSPERADKINAAAESVAGNLVGEIRTSFDYYESQNASSIAKIFLSGGGARFSGLKDIVANLLGIEAQNWDPFKKIKISGILDANKLKDAAPQLALAIGLALR